MTSHICGRNTTAILWGNAVVLCEVKWRRFVALFEIESIGLRKALSY